MWCTMTCTWVNVRGFSIWRHNAPHPTPPSPPLILPFKSTYLSKLGPPTTLSERRRVLLFLQIDLIEFINSQLAWWSLFKFSQSGRERRTKKLKKPIKHSYMEPVSESVMDWQFCKNMYGRPMCFQWTHCIWLRPNSALTEANRGHDLSAPEAFLRLWRGLLFYTLFVICLNRHFQLFLKVLSNNLF